MRGKIFVALNLRIKNDVMKNIGGGISTYVHVLKTLQKDHPCPDSLVYCQQISGDCYKKQLRQSFCLFEFHNHSAAIRMFKTDCQLKKQLRGKPETVIIFFFLNLSLFTLMYAFCYNLIQVV